MLFLAGDSTGGQLVDLENKTVVRKYVVSIQQRYSCAFCPGARMIVAHQSKNCTLLLSPSTQQPLHRSFSTETVSSCAISSCGTIMVAGTVTGNILAWNMKSGQLIRNCKAHLRSITCVAISTDDSLVATASEDSTCRVWTMSTLCTLSRRETQPLSTFTGHTLSINCCTFFHHSYRVLTGSSDKTCRIFDASTGEQHKLLTIGDTVSSFSLSSDDHSVVVGTELGYLRFQSLHSELTGLPLGDTDRMRDAILREPTANGHNSPIIFVGFNSDDERSVLTISEGGVLLWYDAHDGRLLGESFHRQAGKLVSCCFVPKLDTTVKYAGYSGLSKNPLDLFLSDYIVERLQLSKQRTPTGKRARDSVSDGVVETELPKLDDTIRELQSANNHLEELKERLERKLHLHTQGKVQ